MEEVAEEFGAKAETIVFLDHFRELPDPRQRGKVLYPLDMGTAVVQGKDSTPVFDDQNGAMRAPDDEPPFALEFLDRACA